MNIVLPLLTLVIGVLVGAVAALAWSRRAGDPDVLRALSARGDDQAVLDPLERGRCRGQDRGDLADAGPAVRPRRRTADQHADRQPDDQQ